MKIITIHPGNLEQEHICCAIGNDKQNQARANTKKQWLKARFQEGLVFKRLDERGKVFIEYMPIEKVWKPVIGANYMAINCLWVSGQFKGRGLSKQLLNECIGDAKAQGMDGVAVVTSGKVKPFLTDKKFYLKHGFRTVDTAPPYFELMTLKFNPDAPNPRFADHAKSGTTPCPNGLAFIFSNQCPFMADFTGIYAALARNHGFETTVIQLTSCEEAQRLGSPFGTMGIYFNGEFKFHELVTEARFGSFLMELENNIKADNQ